MVYVTHITRSRSTAQASSVMDACANLANTSPMGFAGPATQTRKQSVSLLMDGQRNKIKLRRPLRRRRTRAERYKWRKQENTHNLPPKTCFCHHSLYLHVTHPCVNTQPLQANLAALQVNLTLAALQAKRAWSSPRRRCSSQTARWLAATHPR